MPVAGQGVPPEVWDLVVKTAERKEAGPPEEVMDLVEQRQAARKRKDWAAADALREKIEGLGWKVEDGRKGARIFRK